MHNYENWRAGINLHAQMWHEKKKKRKKKKEPKPQLMPLLRMSNARARSLRSLGTGHYFSPGWGGGGEGGGGRWGTRDFGLNSVKFSRSPL